MSDLGGADDAPELRSRRPLTPKSARDLLQPEQVPGPPQRSRAARHPLVVSLNFFLTIAVVAVVAVGGVAAFAWVQFDRDGPLAEERVLPVAEGDGLTDIAEGLQEGGMISNRWVFRIAVTFYGNQAKLKAGEYLIPAQASMREVMDLLVEGRTLFYAVTIPEGLTSQQIVNRLMADEVLAGEIEEVPAEGMLLPETYQFSRGDTRQSVIDRMLRDHDRLVAEIWSRRVDGLPLSSPDELVVLASIVEKETGLADERSRVAAVFINRLNAGMRLQSDPTIIYGVFGGEGPPSGHIITQSELARVTAYNTYQIDGLPPGPIANPGVAALEAAANPSQTNDLFFVADGAGGHVFAETLAEHQRNVARWRQIEEQNRAAREAANDPQAEVPNVGVEPAPAAGD